MKNMRYCKKCLLPETHESISFDNEGVCNVCRQVERKHTNINWAERRIWLDKTISKYKGKYLYDCIVPYSGGKDSTFQLYYIVKELGLTPLVVCFDHWGFRPLINENNEKVFKQLGVDVIKFTPNWHIVKDLMLVSFKERGDFCWHCHTGIFGNTLHVALRYQVPLVIYGESSAEYTSYESFEEITELNEKRFEDRISLGLNVDDMDKYLGGKYEKRQLYPYTFPDSSELKKLDCHAIYLGDYISWDTKKQSGVIEKELGWKGQDVEGIPPEYKYEKIECKWQGIRDYCRYIKRGYGRTSHLVAIDIRSERMTSEEGKVLIQKYDGKRPKTLDLFLQILDITEDEFYEILKKHNVEPWHFDCEKIECGIELHDMREWDRTV